MSYEYENVCWINGGRLLDNVEKVCLNLFEIRLNEYEKPSEWVYEKTVRVDYEGIEFMAARCAQPRTSRDPTTKAIVIGAQKTT
jgi:hypothetical protein